MEDLNENAVLVEQSARLAVAPVHCIVMLVRGSQH